MKHDLYRLLNYDIYLYARKKDKNGNKIDGVLKMYKCDVVNIRSPSSFEGAEVDVIGEYGEEEGLKPHRCMQDHPRKGTILGVCMMMMMMIMV